MKNTTPLPTINRPVLGNRNVILSSLAMLAFGAGSLMAAPLIDYNFNSLTNNSSLVGQDGWVATQSPTLATPFVRTGTGVNTSLVASGAASGNNTASKRAFTNFGLTTSSSVILTFDLFGSTTGHELFGIGTSATNSSTATFGVWNGNFAVRGENSSLINAVNSSGGNVTVTASTWYRVQSVWDLSGSGSGSLFVMNLTAGESSYTQLFFDQAQTQATANLSLTSDRTTWNSAFVRMNSSAVAPGQIDNLYVVPEPSVVVLLGAAGAAGLVFLRRRRS